MSKSLFRALVVKSDANIKSHSWRKRRADSVWWFWEECEKQTSAGPSALARAMCLNMYALFCVSLCALWAPGAPLILEPSPQCHTCYWLLRSRRRLSALDVAPSVHSHRAYKPVQRSRGQATDWKAIKVSKEMQSTECSRSSTKHITFITKANMKCCGQVKKISGRIKKNTKM